jgi:hypothetical protein
MMNKKFTLLLILALFLSACAAKPDLSQNGIDISKAQVVLPAGGLDASSAAAAYMLIKNTSGSPDRLESVSANFGDASLHETIMDGDIMKMESIQGITFPAGALIELRSGSYHVMITNLKPDLKAGDGVQITLQFEKAGLVLVPAKVINP